MAIDEPSRSLRSQLKLADKMKSKSALIIGEEGLKNKLLNLKILETGKELKLDFEALKNMANIGTNMISIRYSFKVNLFRYSLY
jgi:histidyl-tRNA synthetase